MAVGMCVCVCVYVCVGRRVAAGMCVCMRVCVCLCVCVWRHLNQSRHWHGDGPRDSVYALLLNGSASKGEEKKAHLNLILNTSVII